MQKLQKEYPELKERLKNHIERMREMHDDPETRLMERTDLSELSVGDFDLDELGHEIEAEPGTEGGEPAPEAAEEEVEMVNDFVMGG